MTRRDRLEARAAKREEWAGKAKARQKAARNAAWEQTASGAPMGQPILVGHHSEKRARRDQERMANLAGKAVEAGELAKRHAAKAGNLDRMLDRSIFADDEDAAERLRERIAENEAKRDRMKAINREIKKGAGWSKRAEVTQEEARELDRYSHTGTVGYPPFSLTNLGSRIRSDRKRLAELEAVAPCPRCGHRHVPPCEGVGE